MLALFNAFATVDGSLEKPNVEEICLALLFIVPITPLKIVSSNFSAAGVASAPVVTA